MYQAELFCLLGRGEVFCGSVVLQYEGDAAAGPAHNLIGTFNTAKRLAELLPSVIGLLKSVYLRKHFLRVGLDDADVSRVVVQQ